MRVRQVQFTVFSIAVTAGVFAYLLSKVSVAEVLNIIRNIPVAWIGLFILFSFAMSGFRAWRYQLLLGASGYQVSSVSLFLVTLVRNFFSDLLPARIGTLIYIYLIRSRLGIPLAPAMSSFAYAFLFDIISLSLLLIPATLVAGFGFRSSSALWAGGVVLAGMSILILLVLPKLAHMVAAMILAVKKIPEKWRNRMCEELKNTEKHLLLARQRGIYWRVLALSVGVRCCKYLSLYVLLLGLVLPLGHQISDFPLAKVFLGLCSAELASSLPVSGIAGFGAYEGAWTLVFQLLGYEERIAVLTSISHHLFTQVYGYSLGGFALLLLMLPFFEKQQQNTIERADGSGWVFWLKFGSSICCCAIIAGALIGAGSATGAKKTDFRMQQVIPAVSDRQAADLQRTGWLVYEEAGGISIADIHTGESRRLTVNGNYPRWSPDGRYVAFVQGKAIMLIEVEDGEIIKLSEAEAPRAVCFTGDGKTVLFTDGQRLRQVRLENLKVSDILRDGRLLEIDISENGTLLTATVKTVTGFKVRLYDLPSGAGRTVARGCSASLSPDGRYVTVNGADHDVLYVYDTESLKVVGEVQAPAGQRFDNQFWSNDPELLVSTSEGDRNDIFIHDLQAGSARQVTSSGKCDRADLFVSGVVQ
jgi:uncharacterized membrane protein YbhN (UPF0104 family)